jgi:hypothetical protein
MDKVLTDGGARAAAAMSRHDKAEIPHGHARVVSARRPQNNISPRSSRRNCTIAAPELAVGTFVQISTEYVNLPCSGGAEIRTAVVWITKTVQPIASVGSRLPWEPLG